LAHLGHNHLVEVRGLRGALRRLNGGGGLAQLGFRVDEMRVDDPAARALAGSDFAQTPDAAAVTGTRANMLGEKVLNAARWPEIQVSARIADLAAAQPLADIQVSLHGVGRRYQTPVRIQASPGRVSVTGSLFLRQSDFGMAPFSVLGGALQVRDAIEVDFRVVGRNSDDPM
jgi:polyisoprenoid-binding protein YceI